MSVKRNCPLIKLFVFTVSTPDTRKKRHDEDDVMSQSSTASSSHQQNKTRTTPAKVKAKSAAKRANVSCYLLFLGMAGMRFTKFLHSTLQGSTLQGPINIKCFLT